MNSSPTSPRINHQGGFTLPEITVAGAIFTVVGTAIIGVLVSTMQLSSANMVTNLSGLRARQTLDRLTRIIRYAQDTPALINADGSAASGSADGVLVKNALGGPYVVRNADGSSTSDIPSGATSFTLEYSTASDVVAPVPTVGDFIDINIATGPELEITSVSSASNIGSNVSKVVITTKTGTTEKIVASASTTTPSAAYNTIATLYRKEAYVFVQSGSYWNLRYYQSVTSSTNFSSASAYTVEGAGFQKLSDVSNPVWFTTYKIGGTSAVWMRAVARSSDRDEYVELRSGKNTYTAMPMQGKIWNYNAPPP